MSRSIRAHLRSNVVGYISLFLVLSGGTAYALDGENTVFSDDILNGQVKRGDIGGDAVTSGRILDQTVTDTDLAPASVEGSKVLDNSLTGVGIQDDSLDSQVVKEGRLSGVHTRIGSSGIDPCNPSSTTFVTCGDTVSYLFPSTGLGFRKRSSWGRYGGTRTSAGRREVVQHSQTASS